MSESFPKTKISIDTIDVDPAVRTLLPTYLRRRFNDVATIAELLDQEDFTAIRRLGHNMRGSGAAYGLSEVSHFGAYIETAAENSNHEKIWEWTEALHAFVSRFDLDSVDIDT